MAEAKSKNTTPPKVPSKPAVALSKSTATKAKPLAAPKKTSTAKPVAKKPAAKKKTAVAKKPATKKAASASRKTAAKSAAPKKTKPGPEAVYRMIQDAAYFIAERNGFAGDSKTYWAQAEIQIARLLK